MKPLCSLLALSFIFISAGQAQAAEFHPLGFGLSTNIHVNRLNVSEDGSVVVGTSLEQRLIRWTRETGPRLLGPELNPVEVFASSMSGDASTVAATVYLSPFDTQAVKISDGVIEALPVGPDIDKSEARLISQDGSTVYGHIYRSDDIRRPVRWTDDGIFELPDELALVKALSASGEVFVSFDSQSTYRWSEATGVQELPALPLKPNSLVIGVSSDGRWSVGRATVEGAAVPLQRQAVRWDGISAPELLLPANSSWGTTALDVTADGSRIAGRIYKGNVAEDHRRDIAAGLWTEETGMVPLQDLLTDQYGLGEALEGWQLTGVYDITDDGRFMAGTAINPAGIPEAFLVDMDATLGSLSDLTGNGFVDFEDLTVLLANWNQHVPPEEGNLVDPFRTPVNFEDLTVLLADWTGPGPAGSPEGALGAEAVPEPSTLALALAAALVGMSAVRRRRRG